MGTIYKASDIIKKPLTNMSSSQLCKKVITSQSGHQNTPPSPKLEIADPVRTHNWPHIQGPIAKVCNSLTETRHSSNPGITQLRHLSRNTAPSWVYLDSSSRHDLLALVTWRLHLHFQSPSCSVLLWETPFLLTPLGAL